MERVYIYYTLEIFYNYPFKCLPHYTLFLYRNLIVYGGFRLQLVCLTVFIDMYWKNIVLKHVKIGGIH